MGSEIVELCCSYGMARLEVFGSAARDTDFDPDTSDVDCLVELVSPRARSILDRHFGFHEDFTTAFGREVDLISGLPDNKCLLAGINERRAPRARG